MIGDRVKMYTLQNSNGSFSAIKFKPNDKEQLVVVADFYDPIEAVRFVMDNNAKIDEDLARDLRLAESMRNSNKG